MSPKSSPNGRPKVLGLGSSKGGVGKTQTAVTLAHLASTEGYRVLLVDADPNLSAHDWVMRSGDRMNFDVAVEESEKALTRLRELQEFDVVIVDLPGSKTSEAWRALLSGADGAPVVDALLVPSQVFTMDLRAVTRVIREAIIPTGVPYLLVGTRVRTSSLHLAQLDLSEIAGGGLQVARTIIRDLTVHSDAVRDDRPITDMPGGRHSTARAAEREYRALAREVLGGMLGLKWSAPSLIETSVPRGDSNDDDARTTGRTHP